MNWLNRLAESRGLSIKVYLNEVYVGMLHGTEPCTMETDVFHILHNYSNIVSFRCNFQTNRGIYIYGVNECQTHIHDAHIHLHIQPVHS